MTTNRVIHSQRFKLGTPQLQPKLNPFMRVAQDPAIMVLVKRCAARARIMAAAWRSMSIANGRDEFIEVNDQITQIDFAVAFLRRDYDLQKALNANDHAFMADFSAIQKNIVREKLFLASDVTLRFARNGSRITGM